VALVPAASEWIDQRFRFHELAALAEDLTRPLAALRMVVDPFNPLADWRVGYDTEHGHAGRAFDRLRAFAAPHQARCWLVGLPVRPGDLGPTEGMRQLLEKQAKEEGHIVRMGRTSAQEALDASGPAMPPLAQWTHLADEVFYIHQGKAYSAWRRPEYW
jgi:hypothetical protein